MIYQLGFAGRLGGFGQLGVGREHVDEGTLAHIGAADKSEFGRFARWFLGNPRAASGKFRLGNFHDLLLFTPQRYK
jgi:hypothetical protein